MTVFKNYFKIINKHKFSLLLYSIISFVVIVGFSSNIDNNMEKTFESYKPIIYLENNSDSILAEGLVNMLKDNTKIEKNTSKENAEDELFYEMISAIIVIPEGFEETKKVEYKTNPKQAAGVLTKQLIDNYLNKVNGYLKANFKEEKAVSLAREDIKKEIKVNYLESNEEKDNGSQYYFNFLNYTLIAQIMISIMTIMLIYNKKEISDRNRVSPVSATRQKMELILGHIVIATFIWLLYMVMYGIFWPEGLGLKSTNLMMFNSYVFSIFIVIFTIFITKFIKSEGALQGIMNTVSLGSSFLAGAFVPREILSEPVVKFSKILPSYYYIDNNIKLATNPSFKIIMPNLLVIAGFALVFLVLNIVIKKEK